MKRVLFSLLGIILVFQADLLLAGTGDPQPAIFQVNAYDSSGTNGPFTCTRDTIIFYDFPESISLPQPKGKNCGSLIDGRFGSKNKIAAWDGGQLFLLETERHYVNSLGCNYWGNFFVATFTPNIWDLSFLRAYDLNDDPVQQWEVNLNSGYEWAPVIPKVDVSTDGSVIICTQVLMNPDPGSNEKNTLIRSFDPDDGESEVLYEEEGWVPLHNDVSNDGEYFLFISSDYYTFLDGLNSEDGLHFKVTVCESTDGDVVWETDEFLLNDEDLPPVFGFTNTSVFGFGAKFSGDGSRIVINVGHYVGVYEADDGDLIWSDDSEFYTATAISDDSDEDGSLLILGSFSWWPQPQYLLIKKMVWNAANTTYDEEWEWGDPWGLGQFTGVTEIVLSSNDQFIGVGGLWIVGEEHSRIGLWHTDDDEPLWIQSSLTERIHDLSISCSGNFLTASSFGSVEVDDPPRNAVFKTDSGEPVITVGDELRANGHVGRISRSGYYSYHSLNYQTTGNWGEYPGGWFEVRTISANGDIDEDETWWGYLQVGENCRIVDDASVTFTAAYGYESELTLLDDFEVNNGIFTFNTCDNVLWLYLNDHNFITLANGSCRFEECSIGATFIMGPGFISLDDDSDIRIDGHEVGFFESPWMIQVNEELHIGDGSLVTLDPGWNSNTWSIVYLNEDIVVEEGGTLVVHPSRNVGQYVEFHGPGRIINEGGRVSIRGTASDPHVFTSGEAIPTRGDWQGIYFENVTEACTLEYVDIEYAVDAVKLSNCSNYVLLDHVTMTDFSSTGLNLVNSSPTISYCSASDSEPAGSIQPVGLYCYGSCPKLTHSTFDNNYRGAEIIGVASVAYAGYNSFSDNHDVGIYFYDATGYLYNSTGYPNYGYNHIITNGSDGLYADGSAYPYLGYGSMGQGMNSIYSNFQYEVNNQNPAELQAENNWWGSCGGPLTIYGPVDYTPWLYSPPGGGPAPRKPDDQDGGGVIAGADDDDNPFHVADSLFVRGRFAEALQAYGAHAQDVASEGLLTAIRQIRQCYAELDRRNDWHGLLERLLDNRRLRANLRPLIVSLLAEENAVSNPDDAVEMIEATLDDFDREDTECAPLLFQIAMIQHYRLDNPESATRTLRDFLESFREHPLQSIVERELAVCLGEIDAGGNRPPVEDSDHFIPNIVTLYDPQPNPFNSSTTISYSLPERVHVRLMLYDVSGRQIETLVDRVQAAGEHALVWNAESLAAGMYICKLKAGDATDTVKLVMIK
jgi:hypothetical protein